MGQCVYPTRVCASQLSSLRSEGAACCSMCVYNIWTLCDSLFFLSSLMVFFFLFLFSLLPPLSRVKPTSKPSRSAQCSLCSPHQTPLLSHLRRSEQRVFISKHSAGRDSESLTRASRCSCGVKKIKSWLCLRSGIIQDRLKNPSKCSPGKRVRFVT